MKVKLDMRVGEPEPDFLQDRCARLSRIVTESTISPALIERDLPLLKVIRLPEPTLQLLTQAVILYVWENLGEWYRDREFAPNARILDDNVEAVFALPNRTPNGLIMPRRGAVSSLNLMHRILTDFFRHSGLLDHFEAIQLPVNVRVVSGNPQSGVDQRPYASSKIHSDTWNREPLNALLFNIPLLGDPTRVAIRYYAMRDPRPEHFTPLTDYSEAPFREEDLIAYDAPFQLGRMYMSDEALLHQTERKGQGGVRLSLDFRALARDLTASEHPDTANSPANYVPSDQWQRAGGSTLLVTRQPIDAFQRRLGGETEIIDENAIYDIDPFVS